jgi:PAS domain S-box-containing protein
LNDVVIITEPAPELQHGRRIVFVNDAFMRLTGYAREDVIGRSPGLLDGPLTDAAELARIRDAVDRFAPVHVELMRTTKDGREYAVEIDITPVATAGEGFTHFVSVIRDISERRRSEQTLLELNAGLEERVRHRTL